MAAEVVTNKIAVTVKLENGTTESGNVKTVSQSIGALNASTFDATKALNVVGLLMNCLDRELVTVIKTETSTIREAA